MTIPNFESTAALRHYLHTEGCRRCDLGFQDNINGCCVARGPNDSKRMIVGEAPGKDEDATREPFTGPAGQLLDKIWDRAGLDTKDWYITNATLCRYVAPWGSGRQNLTAKVEQRKRCKPYLETQIELLQPNIIVTLGRIALEEILQLKGIRMGDYRGRLITDKNYLVFPMVHPAAILHASSEPQKHLLYRQQTWDDVRKLKGILNEYRI
jgi:DNA polymerase